MGMRRAELLGAFGKDLEVGVAPAFLRPKLQVPGEVLRSDLIKNTPGRKPDPLCWQEKRDSGWLVA